MRQISHSAVGAYEAALAVFDDGFAAAWYDTRDGNPEIYVRWLHADGSPAGPATRLTNDAELSYEVSVDSVGRDLAVAWYGKTASGDLTARVGVWTRDGQRKWQQAMPQGSRNPVIRAAADRLYGAWIQQEPAGEFVWGRWWSADGERLGDAVRLAPASASTWNLNAAIDATGAPWLVFDAVAGTKASELFVVRPGPRGGGVVRLSEDDGIESKYPDVAILDSRAAITWFDARDGNTEIYLAALPVIRLMSEDVGGIAERTGRRVTTSAGESIGAYVAWHGGRVGLAWSDNSQGGQHDVFFQTFDAEGTSLGEARRVTRSAAASLIPAIRPAAGGFALAWNEYEASAHDRHDEGARSQIGFALVD